MQLQPGPALALPAQPTHRLCPRQLSHCLTVPSQPHTPNWVRGCRLPEICHPHSRHGQDHCGQLSQHSHMCHGGSSSGHIPAPTRALGGQSWGTATMTTYEPGSQHGPTAEVGRVFPASPPHSCSGSGASQGRNWLLGLFMESCWLPQQTSGLSRSSRRLLNYSLN